MYRSALFDHIRADSCVGSFWLFNIFFATLLSIETLWLDLLVPRRPVSLSEISAPSLMMAGVILSLGAAVDISAQYLVRCNSREVSNRGYRNPQVEMDQLRRGAMTCGAYERLNIRTMLRWGDT